MKANGKCGEFYYKPQDIPGVVQLVTWTPSQINDQFTSALIFTVFTNMKEALGTKTLEIKMDSEYNYASTTYFVEITTKNPEVPLPCVTRFDKQGEKTFYTYQQKQPDNDPEIGQLFGGQGVNEKSTFPQQSG